MVEIVKFAPAHVPEAAALEKLCFSLPWSEAMLLGEIESPLTHWFAAVEDGQLVGYAGFQAVLDEGYIANVATAPDCRRRGVASRLLGAMGDRAMELKLSFLTLEVRAGNEPAIALYAKHGYQLVGRRKNYYSAPVEDALLMTCRFEVEV